MSKFVSNDRLRQAILRLKQFRHTVHHQGIQHLLPFLALRQKGVHVAGETRFEEKDDFDFWDRYFLVDPTSQDGRYYDPFSGERRISTHPHSNVATARKGTFVASWHAANSRSEDGEYWWELSDDYLSLLTEKMLTKAGETHRVPLLDLVAWLKRSEAIPDERSTGDLVTGFRDEFGLTDVEMGALFEVIAEPDESFFSNVPGTAEDVLDIVGRASPTAKLSAGGELGTFVSAAKGMTLGLALPSGVMEQALAGLSVGSHLLLAGPPGTGKSTLAERLAAAATQANYVSGYKTTTATADWTTFDTVGGYIPVGDGNRLTFQEGVVLSSIREDAWCVVDELNRANIDKAIGPLISLLAGSEDTAIIELPYRHQVGEGATSRTEPVRIRRDIGRERSGQDPDSGDYVIGRNWRLIATMNTLDRNNLFPLTAAFARRFATVYVGIPPADSVLDVLAVGDGPARAVARVILTENDEAWRNPRPLGPAIVRDAWKYVVFRTSDDDGGGITETQAMIEAVVLYVLPQYSGLELNEWDEIRDRLIDALVVGVAADAANEIRGSSTATIDAAFRGLQGE